ncbi:uncharacterized protein [Dermacentor andersoni]|uniref:uncharacterized protein n=1 Tax=Dermacentor andersoni TaxID=34620 RepID=UPI003B3A87EB
MSEGEFRSQPLIGTKPRCNNDLATALLFSGPSPTSALRMMRLMGVQFMSDQAFFNYPKAYLLPGVTTGFVRGIKFLCQQGMTVSSLTTDRHSGIKKHMRLQCPEINHHFYVWHVAKAYKQIGCIVAAPLLLKDIRQLSPSVQTYSLESFHSVLNSFAAKSTAFTYEGMKARTLIAALDFNENSQREQARRCDGAEQWCIKSFKVRQSTWTACVLKTAPTFGKSI